MRFDCIQHLVPSCISLVGLEPVVPLKTLTGGLFEKPVTGAIHASASRHRSDQNRPNPRSIRKLLAFVKVKDQELVFFALSG
jgi:hypothetical protein